MIDNQLHFRNRNLKQCLCGISVQFVRTNAELVRTNAELWKNITCEDCLLIGLQYLAEGKLFMYNDGFGTCMGWT
jgi:hypothetical protein